MAEDFGELVASTVSSFTLHSADGECGESTLGESINFVGLPDLEGGPKKRKEQAPQEATQEAPQEAAQEEAPQEETKHDTMGSSAPKQSADGDKEAPQEATQEAHVKEVKT